MDRLIDWLDNSNVFAPIGHAWPWAMVTALLAIGVLTGIVLIARSYGHPHNTLAD